MTDSSGNIQAEYSVDPFGRTIKLQGTLDSEFQFAAFYIHLRSGLNLAAFRSFNSVQGRWTSRDPVGELAGPNLYAYCKNSPENIIDPLGLMAGGGGNNGWGNQFPPCFDSCDAGDLECCETRWADCQSRCRQFYANRPGPGNDLLDQCLRCCAQTHDDCTRNTAPNNPFEGRNWQDCFKNRPNKRPPRRGGLGGGGAAAPGGGGWPRNPNYPPPKQNNPSVPSN
jgi:RHS repeat-associated protein